MGYRMHWPSAVVGVSLAQLLAAAIAILFATADAHAAAQWCECEQQSFVWQGCDATGSCDPGGWTHCSPSPDDSFTIRNGCHVVVNPGSDVLLSQVLANRTTVEAGGSLVVNGPSELRLGPLGLTADPGSTVDFSGCFRRFGAGESCVAALGADSLFPIGLVVPCRDGDCTDDPEVVRIVWNETTDALTLSQIDSLLEGIEVARDVLCFWQNAETGPIGADAGYCYKVVGKSLGPIDRTLDFDIRQTWSAQSDQAGYPLSRRVVQPVTLAKDMAIGARTFSFTETTPVVGRANPVGRWIRCGNDQRAYVIATATDDAAGDAVLIADGRGVEAAYPAGTQCYLDWGWGATDIAFVMAPVHVTSLTNQPGDSWLLLQGDTTLRAVVVDGLGGDTDTTTKSALTVRGGPLRALEHVWVTDPLVKDRAAVLLDDLPCGTAINHLTVTGGPPSIEDNKNYGLAWHGGAACSYRATHLYTRFAGDDNFVLESTGADPVAAISLQYMEAGPSSLPGDSGQLFDFGDPNPTSVVVQDALCTSCTSDDGFGSLMLSSSGPAQIDDVLWIGARNGGVLPDAVESNHPSVLFRRLGVIGSNVDATNQLGKGPLVGIDAQDFYVRDIVDPRPASIQLCTGNQFGAQTHALSRGVFHNIALGQTPCEVSRAQISDVYFIDVRREDSVGPLLEVRPLATAPILSRLTMAFQKEPTGVTAGISAPFAGAAPQLTIDGTLLTGFRGPQTLRAMSLGTAATAAPVNWGAPACFFDNVQDEYPDTLAAYGVSPVQGVDPLFVDPDALLYNLAPASPLRTVGCGARKAGFLESNWAHRKAKLEPVFIGPHGTSPDASAAELTPALFLIAAVLQRVSERRRNGRWNR